MGLASWIISGGEGREGPTSLPTSQLDRGRDGDDGGRGGGEVVVGLIDGLSD